MIILNIKLAKKCNFMKKNFNFNLWDPIVTYNNYYDDFYDQRYPTYNYRTLSLLINFTMQANMVLDFGCGNGRYTIPIAEKTSAKIFAYDICHKATSLLKNRISTNPIIKDKISIIDSLTKLELYKNSFDAIIAIFGVISHINDKKERLKILAKLRDLLSPKGSLIITVPNAYRRFYREQLKYSLIRKFNETNAGIANFRNDITYNREINGLKNTFYYHLYTTNSLENELNDAGLIVNKIFAESILSESYVTRSLLFYKLDKYLLSCLPNFLGYGLLAISSKE